MFTDNFEKFGVTADWKKVLPGMVYVDLQESKSKKEIYSAYNNGASVIFTTQNISNPELPVIKVNNVYETMLLMLDKHFHSPQNTVKLVAVSGSNDKDIILDLLYKVLGEKNRKFKAEEEKEFMKYLNSLKSMTVEDIYERLDKMASIGEHFMPIVVDYKLKYFRFINSFRFDCALISGVNSMDMVDKNYVLESIRGFIAHIPESKPIIVNNDDDLVLKALGASKNTIVITYGLNKKAAVTATSIDVNQQTTFNYCLQRSFYTNSGNLLEPFEMPITINMLGSKSIHNALAVITCALYYDIDIKDIKDALLGYVSPSRRFEISDIKGIRILDNYCSSAGDLDKTLEGLQLLNYNTLGLLLSVNKTEDWQDMNSIIRVMNQWSSILGIHEVVMCGCIDINEKITPLSINDIRKFKKALNDLPQIRYFDKLQNAIAYMSTYIKDGDLLVLAGGDEMNNAKGILEGQLKRVLSTLH
ncbi:MAG: hypothetical protein A2Y23_14425 [Clostridiales bacterium GWB2_37_7]|nr:MAG: hypothetical protein A2Y23_14425 [Clostridiales bacterium GWB2_37_7]